MKYKLVERSCSAQSPGQKPGNTSSFFHILSGFAGNIRPINSLPLGETIRYYCRSDPGLANNLSALYLCSEQAYIVHVRGSRITRLRARQLEQITIDQPPAGLLQQSSPAPLGQVQEGLPAHILLQDIGISADLEPYLDDFAQQRRDLFLLCSDGLSDMHNEHRLATELRAKQTLRQTSEELFHAAMAGSAHDNIRLILVQVDVGYKMIGDQDESFPLGSKSRNRF